MKSSWDDDPGERYLQAHRRCGVPRAGQSQTAGRGGHACPDLRDRPPVGLRRSHQLQAALAVVSMVFLVAPPVDTRAPERLVPFIAAAIASGVRHVVGETFTVRIGPTSRTTSPMVRRLTANSSARTSWVHNVRW